MPVVKVSVSNRAISLIEIPELGHPAQAEASETAAVLPGGAVKRHNLNGDSRDQMRHRRLKSHACVQ